MKNDILTQENEKVFRAKVTAGFRRIRKLGYFARQNFWCCQSCAWSNIPEENDKVVFYHEQDNDDIKYGNVLLAWRGNADEIKHVFSLDGLMLSGGETEEERIQVTFLDDLKKSQ